jgi:hypothetical protein
LERAEREQLEERLKEERVEREQLGQTATVSSVKY